MNKNDDTIEKLSAEIQEAEEENLKIKNILAEEISKSMTDTEYDTDYFVKAEVEMRERMKRKDDEPAKEEKKKTDIVEETPQLSRWEIFKKNLKKVML